MSVEEIGHSFVTKDELDLTKRAMIFGVWEEIHEKWKQYGQYGRLFSKSEAAAVLVANEHDSELNRLSTYHFAELVRLRDAGFLDPVLINDLLARRVWQDSGTLFGYMDSLSKQEKDLLPYEVVVFFGAVMQNWEEIQYTPPARRQSSSSLLPERVAW